MATVKYIANSDIAVNVVLKSGLNKHIKFNQLTGLRSTYITDDEDVQEALEKHSKYGNWYRRDTTYNPEPVAKVEKTETAEESKTKQVTVSCLEDAKDYLAEQYGISRTQLRSEAKIKEKAASLGIEIVGI